MRTSFAINLRGNPALNALVPVDGKSEKLAGGFTFVEGPLWRPEGTVWFSDVIGNVVRQWSPDGNVVDVLRPGGYDGNALPAGGMHRYTGRILMGGCNDCGREVAEAAWVGAELVDRHGGDALPSVSHHVPVEAESRVLHGDCAAAGPGKCRAKQ